MTRFARFPLLALFFVGALTVAGAETGFQSMTIHFGEQWTGNAYRLPYVDATFSEGVPIDTVLGGGARFTLVEQFLLENGRLTFDPRLIIGVRRYQLYQSGWTVPTQLEAAVGEDEDGTAYGSSRVLSMTVGLPFALEIGFTERIALSVGLSPTLVFRVRAGDSEVLPPDETSVLNQMYSFFYGRLRWLRPEFHLAGRFDLSEYFAFAIRTTWSFSILDIVDPTLPAWDQMQAGAALELCLTPPLSGLFRGMTEETQ